MSTNATPAHKVDAVTGTARVPASSNPTFDELVYQFTTSSNALSTETKLKTLEQNAVLMEQLESTTLRTTLEESRIARRRASIASMARKDDRAKSPSRPPLTTSTPNSLSSTLRRKQGNKDATYSTTSRKPFSGCGANVNFGESLRSVVTIPTSGNMLIPIQEIHSHISMESPPGTPAQLVLGTPQKPVILYDYYPEPIRTRDGPSEPVGRASYVTKRGKAQRTHCGISSSDIGIGHNFCSSNHHHHDNNATYGSSGYRYFYLRGNRDRSGSSNDLHRRMRRHIVYNTPVVCAGRPTHVSSARGHSPFSSPTSGDGHYDSERRHEPKKSSCTGTPVRSHVSELQSVVQPSARSLHGSCTSSRQRPATTSASASTPRRQQFNIQASIEVSPSRLPLSLHSSRCRGRNEAPIASINRSTASKTRLNTSMRSAPSVHRTPRSCLSIESSKGSESVRRSADSVRYRTSLNSRRSNNSLTKQKPSQQQQNHKHNRMVVRKRHGVEAERSSRELGSDGTTPSPAAEAISKDCSSPPIASPPPSSATSLETSLQLLAALKLQYAQEAKQANVPRRRVYVISVVKGTYEHENSLLRAEQQRRQQEQRQQDTTPPRARSPRTPSTSAQLHDHGLARGEDSDPAQPHHCEKVNGTVYKAHQADLLNAVQKEICALESIQTSSSSLSSSGLLPSSRHGENIMGGQCTSKDNNARDTKQASEDRVPELPLPIQNPESYPEIVRGLLLVKNSSSSAYNWAILAEAMSEQQFLPPHALSVTYTSERTSIEVEDTEMNKAALPQAQKQQQQNADGSVTRWMTMKDMLVHALCLDNLQRSAWEGLALLLRPNETVSIIRGHTQRSMTISGIDCYVRLLRLQPTFYYGWIGLAYAMIEEQQVADIAIEQRMERNRDVDQETAERTESKQDTASGASASGGVLSARNSQSTRSASCKLIEGVCDDVFADKTEHGGEEHCKLSPTPLRAVVTPSVSHDVFYGKRPFEVKDCLGHALQICPFQSTIWAQLLASLRDCEEVVEFDAPADEQEEAELYQQQHMMEQAHAPSLLVELQSANKLNSKTVAAETVMASLKKLQSRVSKGGKMSFEEVASVALSVNPRKAPLWRFVGEKISLANTQQEAVLRSEQYVASSSSSSLSISKRWAPHKNAAGTATITESGKGTRCGVYVNVNQIAYSGADCIRKADVLQAEVPSTE